MNCLMQKALKDHVMVNRCVLDSVLWFHVECPRWADKFDDPVEFKKKFRDFFAHNKSIYDNLNQKTRAQERIKKAYGYQSAYPEDMQVDKRAQKYMEEFRKFSPDVQPVDLDEEDPYAESGFNKPHKNSEALYGKKIDYLQVDPINLYESGSGLADLRDDSKQ